MNGAVNAKSVYGTDGNPGMPRAADTPPARTAKKISGNTVVGSITAGSLSARTADLRDRCAMCATFGSSIAIRVTLCRTTGTLERVPGLRQEDIVQRRLVKVQRGDPQTPAVDQPYDLCQVDGAVGEPHGNRAFGPGRHFLSKLRQDFSEGSAFGRIDGQPLQRWGGRFPP